MTRLHIVLICMLLPASPAFAMTLEQAVEAALKNNPDLQVLGQEQIAAQGRLDQAGLLLQNNPVIEGGLSNKKVPIDSGGERFRNYEVRLSQEFEIAGQRGLRIDAAQKDFEMIALELRDRERLLAAEVKDAFAKALASKKKKELAGETVKLQEELYTFAEIKFKAGEVAALEMNLAAVELGKAKRDLLLAIREQREALLALQGLLGLRPDTGFTAEGELPSEAPSAPDKEGLRSLAAARRPDIHAVSADVSAAMSAMRLAGRQAVPNVTLSGFYEKDERADITGVMLSIPLPLFDRNQAVRKETLVKAAQAKIRQAGLEKTLEREIEESYYNFTSALEELSLFKKEILGRAVENLALVNLSYREGKIGFFEVRLAQKDTIETRFAYLDSQLRAQLAINALEKVTGGSLK